MPRTITTTTQVAGYRFSVSLLGTSDGGSKVAIGVQHVDISGASVRVPRATAQTVRRPHAPDQPIPPRPVDTSLAAVLSMPQFVGVPALLAEMAAAYEALEYPMPAPPAPAARPPVPAATASAPPILQAQAGAQPQGHGDGR